MKQMSKFKLALVYTLVLTTAPIVYLAFEELLDRRALGLVITGLIITVSSLFVLKIYKDKKITLTPFSGYTYAEAKLFIAAIIMTVFGFCLVLAGFYQCVFS